MGADDIEIYDADLRPLGRMDWMEAHLTGQWHRTFHCWVYAIHPHARVLFQARSPHGNFPNMLDVSAAGHLDAGETELDGIRELREELGLDADAADLTFIGQRVEVADQDNGQHNREYQSVFLLKTDLELSEFTLDPKEVWGAYWVSIDDGLALFAGRADSITTAGVAYDDQAAQYVASVRDLTVDDFLPRIQRYYMAAMIAVERAVEGKEDIAIS